MERTLKKFDRIKINTENGRSSEYGLDVFLEPEITQISGNIWLLDRQWTRNIHLGI